MPRESLGFVKLEWVCPKCNSRNPGPEKTCLSCGAPQPEEVEFQQAERQEMVKDQATLEQARLGPDVHCAFCGTRNPANAVVCSQCGADLRKGVKRQAGRVVGAYSDAPARQVACPNCGTMNPETALKCSQCGAPTNRLITAPPEAVAAGTRRKMPLWVGAVIAVAVLACLSIAAYFIFLAAKTESFTGTVDSVSWLTTVVIESLQPVTHQDWLDQIPADAQMGACTAKVHHVQDEPAENANKVCGTPYTVDRGSGFAEVVQDCKYEVLMDYCQYTVREWAKLDEIKLEGRDYSPSFANPQLTTDQRVGSQEQVFSVVFLTSDGQYTYTLTDLALFNRFEMGSQWILTINGLGKVVSVEPAQ